MTQPSSNRPSEAQPLRVALAGLGTVGTGVVRLIEENRDLIARRAGRPVEIVAVSARERNRDRGIDLSSYRWCDDMAAFAQDEDVDVVCELVGGSDGPALALARAALGNGKALVTANKALIAHHGLELAEIAEKSDAPMLFEAAVAGAIPVIKGLREGAAANRIERVYGILNGTCNYVLSAMEAKGEDFGKVLADAQAIGYAEADPAFDIEGTDAAHKLSILASLCFGTKLDFAGVETRGITQVRAEDIAQARALGYVIRLIGFAEADGGKLFQRVHPCLLPLAHPLARIDGATNAVVAEGNYSGRLLFQGAGAGDGPTASAVVADLVDLARGQTGHSFAMPASALEPAETAETGHRSGKVYLRFEVADKVGVLAEIAAAMRDAGVSVESLIQPALAGGDTALIAIVTHEVEERCIDQALAKLSGSDSQKAEPMVMHIMSA